MSEDGVLSAVGTTRHCFLNKDGRPVMMNKEMKEFSDVMQKYFEEIDEYKS